MIITMLEKYGTEQYELQTFSGYTRRYMYECSTCIVQLLNFLDDALALNDACFLLRPLFEKDIYSVLKFFYELVENLFSTVLSTIKYNI
jgi:hypothetical protein